MPHRIVREELELLARVSAQLAASSTPERRSEAAVIEDLERIREVILNRDEMKDLDRVYDEWRRQSHLLAQLRSSRTEEIDPRSPYFGHMRLRRPSGEQDLCIGKATRIERDLRIVDWRNAPVSKLFYRYQQGEEYIEEFGGRVMEGRLEVRRIVEIAGGELQRIDAPEGSFRGNADAKGGWERLVAATARLGGVVVDHGQRAAPDRLPALPASRLGGGEDGRAIRTDKRLPEITSLLDPEQFELITRPSAGFLLIRGVAGSGKTTVALHRIAYLAYDDPQIDSARTLVLMFSRGLQRYVEHVLPSLGLEKVAIQTYSQWAFHLRCRHFPELPRATREDTPARIQAMKLHPALLSALEEEVAEEPGEADGEQARDDWMNLLVNRHRLHKHFADSGFSRGDVEDFVDLNRERQAELSDFLAGRELEEDEPAPQVELDPEDDPLLLRAWQLRVGPLRRGQRPLRFRHVTVDEVQDFSPLEIQLLLGCLDDERSITLSGDTQQHVTRSGGFDSWSDFLDRVGVPGSAVETLRIPYRCTREIVDFSLALLGDLREDEDLAEAPRSGPPVELFRFTDRGSCVAFLAEALEDLRLREPLASVVLLTPSESISEDYARGFEQTDLVVERVVDYSFSFQPGIEIADVAQTKGLEFDYVVLLDVDPLSYPDDSFNRRLLHVGATRAIHQLWVTCVGVPSAIVDRAIASLET